MFDPILAIWVILSTSIGGYGLFWLATDDLQASKFYVYGKSLELIKKNGFFWKVFLVPKRYFGHFYLTGTLAFMFSLAIAVIHQITTQSSTNTNALNQLVSNLNLVNKSFAHYNIRIESATNVETLAALYFTLIVMTIQCLRRLYESQCVSVFSSNSKINVIHYLFGHAFYVTAAISTLCPIILSQASSQFTTGEVLDNFLTRKRAIWFVIFVYVVHHQHKCHVILANLRKDKTGQVISEQHYVPSGGLFCFVSCPHFLLEIITYFTIISIQEFSNSYWNMIFVLVSTTQTISALTEHRWYKRKYKDYPKERKAIIPKLL